MTTETVIARITAETHLGGLIQFMLRTAIDLPEHPSRGYRQGISENRSFFGSSLQDARDVWATLTLAQQLHVRSILGPATRIWDWLFMPGEHPVSTAVLSGSQENPVAEADLFYNPYAGWQWGTPYGPICLIVDADGVLKGDEELVRAVSS